MGSRAAFALAVAVAVTATTQPARGDGQHLLLDQATLEPSTLHGLARLRLYASAIDVRSGVIDVPGDAWSLRVGKSEKDAPFVATAYGATASPTAIVLVVQTSFAFRPRTAPTDAKVKPEDFKKAEADREAEARKVQEAAFATILKALDTELVAGLSASTQIAILPYGDVVGEATRLGTPKLAQGKLATLTVDADHGEPMLVETIEKAVGMLRKLKPDPIGQPLRKMIVVFGDGRDVIAIPEEISALGRKAATTGVRIMSVAYSPTKSKRPMLALGELSKRSLGSFRLVRDAGDLGEAVKSQLVALREDIDRQYVLTFFVEPDVVANKRLSLVVDLRGKKLTSNVIKVGDVACGGDPCSGACVAGKCVVGGSGTGRGVLGWILLIGGIVIGALVFLAFVGFLLEKRKQRLAHRAALAHALGLTSTPPPSNAALPPGFVVPGSTPPAPGPEGGRIQGVPLPGAGSQPPIAQHVPVHAPPVVDAPVQRIVGVGEGQSTAGSHHAAQPMLYIVNGPRAGQRIPLRHGFVIGKAADADLHIDDGYTSSQHAMILMDRVGNCMVQDRGSTNGTFVNGVRVTESSLTHGMAIKIGSTDLRFLAQ